MRACEFLVADRRENQINRVSGRKFDAAFLLGDVWHGYCGSPPLQAALGHVAGYEVMVVGGQGQEMPPLKKRRPKLRPVLREIARARGNAVDE